MRPRFAAALAALLVAGSLASAAPAGAAPPRVDNIPSPRGVVLEKSIDTGMRSDKGKLERPGPSTRTTITCTFPGCYKYAAKQQIGIANTTDGAQIDLSVHQPPVLSYDKHSLAELAVFNTDNGDLVEAGWTVDNPLYGGGAPRMFVSHWVNGTWGGYSTSFTLSAGRPVSPGDTLTVGSTLTPRWQHYTNAQCGCTAGWWLYVTGSFGAGYVGVYPDTLWSGSFTFIERIDAYGELVLGYDPSQTDMGSGTFATAAQGATMTNYGLYGSAPTTPAWGSTTVTQGDRWPLAVVSGNDFRYGGPGGTETIVGSVTADDCKAVGTGSNPSGMGSFCTYNSNPGLVPTGKVTEIDGVASTSVCRGNIGTSAGYAAISNIAIATYKKVTWFRDGACAGASQIYNHGRVTLPAGWTNLANASYKLSATYATCATGYPGTPPTC